MRPAFSVVVFTTLAGAGQGLFLAVYAADLLSGGSVAQASAVPFIAAGAALAAGLAVLGLAASFFHLGHPERAWRAAAMWRTSWLSREVIVLPLFIALCAAYALATHQGWAGGAWLGAAALLACAALFVCTAMIYMCLRFLQEWASPLTLVNFVLLGAASGCTLAVALSAWLAPQWLATYSIAAILLTLLAMAARAASLGRNARLRPKSSLQSAIGVKSGRIRQIAMGFTAGSFNTREFFHGASPQKLLAVKWGFLLLAFVLPVLLLGAGALFRSTALLAFAFAVQYAGLLAERWYFFAQANHPQNIYYQAIS
jgi:DMSO reductase anchor subunit